MSSTEPTASANQQQSRLTAEQRAMIENNRLSALERKRSRENKRLEIESIRAAKQGKHVPISNQNITLINDVNSKEFKQMGSYGEKLIDTGSGYLIKTDGKKKKPRRIHHELVQEEGMEKVILNTVCLK